MKSNYKTIKIFLLAWLLFVDFYPIALGADEVYSETSTSVNKAKAKNEQKANMKIKDKSDFKENSNGDYELEFTVYQDMDLYFDYNVEEADYGYDEIKINGEDVSLKDVVQLEAGSNKIEIKKENYDNLNSLDVQTHTTPEVNVGINEEEISILINSPIENTELDMQMELLSNIVVDDSEISEDYLYNEHQNKLKLTNLVSSTQYTIPIEIKTQTKKNEEERIKYNYTYTYDQENYYEGTNVMAVSMPVRSQSEGQIQSEEQIQSVDTGAAKRTTRNSNPRLASCSGAYADDFYYMNEDSQKSECEIDLGTNKDLSNSGIAMHRRYVNLNSNFSINFTVEHNNNTASDRVGFYLVNPSLIGYAGEGYYDLISESTNKLRGYYIYIDYEDDPGIHYGQIILNPATEDDVIFVDTGKITDFDTSIAPIEDITFDINYNKVAGEITGIISSSSIGEVTFTQTISDTGNYIMEFISNFSSTAVTNETDVDIMINSLESTGEEIYKEELILEKNTPNIVGDTLDYTFNMVNTSDKFKQIVTKQSTVSDLDGNPLNSNVISNAVIPNIDNTVNQGVSYNQRIEFNIATLEDFLNDRSLVLPNGVKVDTTGNISFPTIETRIGDFNFTSGVSYEIPNLLSTMTSTRSYKAIDLNATVGSDQLIEREEVINLFNLQIHDGYLTPAGATTEDLFNSDRMYIESESTFPIDTTKEGMYRFNVHYITSNGENLDLALIIEVKEPTNNQALIIGESAKNIAYACEVEEASCDNGVGLITIPHYTILDVEYKIDALTHEITIRLIFNEKMYEAGVKTDPSRNLNMIITSPGNGEVVMTEDLPGEATGSYIGPKVVEGIPGYEYEIKTGDLISQGLGLDGIYSISFKEGEEVVAMRSYDTKDTKTSFAVQVPKVKIIDDKRYGLIGDGVNFSTDTSDISEQDVSTPDTVRYSITTEDEEAQKAYGVYELESICYEDSYGEDVDLDSITPDETNWSEDDLTLRKYDHIIRRCDGNFIFANNVDATETLTKVGADKEGGFGDNGFRPIGQGPEIGEDVEFTGIIDGDQSKVKGIRLSSSITDLYINMPHMDNIGLVSINGGQISNLGLKEQETSNMYITGMNNVGAIAGENRGNIINTYSKNGINGVDYVGGLVGTGEGSIVNSYAEGNIVGSNYTGGLVGSLGVAGTINRSYATGDVVAQTISGGLVGENSGTITDAYAIGAVKGKEKLGGLVGDNIGSITNIYATGNITGSTLLGGLVGNNTGIVTNGYGYSLQAINGKFLGLGGVNVIGNDSTYTSYVTYTQLIDNIWYEDTLLYNTDAEQNKIGYDFTSPWKEEVKGLISVCHPHIYRQEEDGEYIPEQNCYKISLPVDYKINAMTLGIIFKFPAGLVSDLDVTVYNEDTSESVTNNVVVNSAGQMQLSPSVFTSIKQDSTLEITILFSGKEMKVRIHTPKQEEIDGVIYAVIGDGVNEDTDVDDLFSSDVSTPSTVKGAGIESALVAGAPAYGVYELESIDYEEYGASTLWTDKDLTLRKYDHIIRPSDGKYLVRGGIDASYTDEESKLGTLKLDINGGFSKDIDGDGIADLNDGYRPIYKFKGTLQGEDLLIDANEPVIDGLYINNTSAGIIESGYGMKLFNIRATNINYINTFQAGGLVSSIRASGLSSIENSSVSGNIEAINTMNGGVIGSIYDSAKLSMINSSSSVQISGTKASNTGGLIGDIDEDAEVTIYGSHNEGDIILTGTTPSAMIGGLVGSTDHFSHVTIKGSYNTGNIKANSSTGGLVGYGYGLDSLESSYNTGDITASSSYVGGLVGRIEYGNIIQNCYNTGDITAGSTVGGLIGFGDDADVTSGGENFIESSYNTGDITGISNVGGLIGEYKRGYYKGLDINNSFAVGDVRSGTEYVGGLVATNIGDLRLNNTYGYEGQKVEVSGEEKNYLIGNDLSYDKRMSYEDVIDDTWYTSTLNWTKYTGVIESETGELCYPHLIPLSNVKEDFVENQPCVVIEEPIDRTTTPKSIVNYKINATTLSVIIKLEDTLKLAKNSTIPLTVTSSSGASITEDATIMDGNILNIDGEKYNIQPDDDITIEFTVAGEANSLKIHTPKQEVYSFDANNDGTIDPETETDLTYALIGDGVNSDTDVEDVFGTETASPTILEDNSEMSSLTAGAPAYGVYELESVCANEQIKSADLWTENDIVLTKYDHIIRPCHGNYMLASNIDAAATATKTMSDIEGGFNTDGFESIGSFEKDYHFSGMLIQKDDTEYVVDKLYSNRVFIDSSDYESQGIISRSTDSTIANLNVLNVDMNQEQDTRVGALSGYDYGSSIINCTVTGEITGIDDAGGFFGGTNKTTIYDSSFDGAVSGGSYAGGLIGGNYVNSTKIDNTIVNSMVTSSATAGGVVGDVKARLIMDGMTIDTVVNATLYALGVGPGPVEIKNSTVNVEAYGRDAAGIGMSDIRVDNVDVTGNIKATKNIAGGICSLMKSGYIKNSTFRGNVEGVDNVGGLIGSLEATGGITIDNSSFEGDIVGETNVGGLVGSNKSNSSNIAIFNSYTKGTLKGTTNAGGLIGQYTGTGELYNNYSTLDMEVIGKEEEPSDIHVGGLIGQVLGNKYDMVIGNCYFTGNIIVDVPLLTKDVIIGGLIGEYKKQAVNTDFYLANSYNTGNISATGSEPTNLYIGGIIGNTSQEGYTEGDLFILNNLNIGDFESTISGVEKNQVGKVIGNYEYDVVEIDYTFLNNYYYEDLTCTISAGSCDFSGQDDIGTNDHAEAEKVATKDNLYDTSWWVGEKVPEDQIGYIQNGLGFNLFDIGANGSSEEEEYTWYLDSVEEGNYPKLRLLDEAHNSSSTSLLVPGQVNIPLPTSEGITKELLSNRKTNLENKNRVDVSSKQKEEDIKNSILDSNKEIKDEEVGETLDESSNIEYSSLKKYMDQNNLDYNKLINYGNSSQNIKLREVLGMIESNLQKDANYLDNSSNDEIVQFLNKFA